MVLAEPNEPIPYAYFLEEGVCSVVARSPEGQNAEVGVIGREGFIIPALALGSDRVPHLCEIQLPGFGRRMRRNDFAQVIAESSTLKDLLLRFAQVMLVQATYTGLSNSVHQVDERLARWLLMCHDRSDSDDLPLTHEFMSVMLAVRRPSVTNALHNLEGRGFIRTDRGYVTIRNRAGLEDYASDAYGKPEDEYRRLIGQLRSA